MNEKTLEKKHFSEFISQLLENNNIFAPVKEDGIISFKKITNSKEIYYDFLNSKIPPKAIFFPQKELLFKYSKNETEMEITDIVIPKKRSIILFMRPCDANGIKKLENIFSFGKYKDKFFLERKNNSIIIGLACNTPRTTCFCTSIGLSPFQEDDFDIFFVDIGQKYIVKGITEKGNNFIQNNSLLKEGSSEDIKKVGALSKKAISQIETNLNLETIDKIIDTLYDDPIWDKLARGCLGCGTCTFLCPTCSCFDVVDERITKKTGQRIRIWDTCQFKLFTLHGSGHNPRPTKKERTRQRIYHKFNYYPKNYDVIGCVGCGRCIINCPINNDIRESLKSIKELGKNKKLEVESSY